MATSVGKDEQYRGQKAQRVQGHETAPAEKRERRSDKRIEGRNIRDHWGFENLPGEAGRIEVEELSARRQTLCTWHRQTALHEADNGHQVVVFVDTEGARNYTGGEGGSQNKQGKQKAPGEHSATVARACRGYNSAP